MDPETTTVIDTPSTSSNMKGQLLPELFKAAQANEARHQEAADHVNRPADQVKATPEKAEPTVKDEPPKETPEKKVPLKVNKSNPMESLRAANAEEKVETSTGEVDQASIDAEVDKEFEDPNKPGGWKNLKTSLKAEKARVQQYERSLAQLKQEVETLKKNPGTSEVSPDIEALKKEYEELKGANAIAAWQTSKEYKEGILAPLTKAYGYVGGLVEKYKLPDHEIRRALQSENRFDRNEILDGILTDSTMSATNQRDFLAAIDDITALEDKKSEGFAKANELYQATLANRSQESYVQTKEKTIALEKAESEIFDQIKSSDPAFSFLNGEFGKESRDYALEYLRNPAVRTPELEAYHAHAAYVLPKMLEDYREVQKELSSYKDSLKKYSNGSPAAGAGAATASTEVRQGPARMSDVGKILGEATRGLRR